MTTRYSFGKAVDLDFDTALQRVDRPGIAEIAGEVRNRLEKVMAAL